MGADERPHAFDFLAPRRRELSQEFCNGCWRLGALPHTPSAMISRHSRLRRCSRSLDMALVNGRLDRSLKGHDVLPFARV